MRVLRTVYIGGEGSTVVPRIGKAGLRNKRNQKCPKSLKAQQLQRRPKKPRRFENDDGQDQFGSEYGQ